MDVVEAIRQRRSIRKYGDGPVSDTDVDAILTAATLAPSGLNKQPWHFIVVRSDAKKREMADLVLSELSSLESREGFEDLSKEIRGYKRRVIFFATAPVVVAVLLRPYRSISLDLIQRTVAGDALPLLRAAAPLQSIGAAIQNIHLAAHALGYGSCSMTGVLFAHEGIERLLGVKAPWRLVALVPIGVPAESPRMPRRKPLDEVRSVIA